MTIKSLRDKYRLDQRFELQYRHNGAWLDRNSGATDYLGTFDPDDLLFPDRTKAFEALHSILDTMQGSGMKRDDLRIVGVDFTDVG
jgi:hypothetical protein